MTSHGNHWNSSCLCAHHHWDLEFSMWEPGTLYCTNLIDELIGTLCFPWLLFEGPPPLTSHMAWGGVTLIRSQVGHETWSGPLGDLSLGPSDWLRDGCETQMGLMKICSGTFAEALEKDLFSFQQGNPIHSTCLGGRRVKGFLSLVYCKKLGE